MSEIDLIPNSYRRMQSNIRSLKILTVVLVVIVVVSGLIFMYVNQEASRLNLEITELQQQKNISVQQNIQLAGLEEARKKYSRQLELLNTLRSGATVGRMFLVVDQALADENLWFLQWQLRRGNAQGLLQGKETEMTIKGQAQDYESLSRFVNNLLGQPEIKHVRVLKSTLRRYTNSSVIDFDLIVHVREAAT